MFDLNKTAVTLDLLTRSGVHLEKWKQSAVVKN